MVYFADFANNVQAVAIEDSDNGLEVVWTSSIEFKSGLPPNNLTLPDQRIARECGKDLCNLVVVVNNSVLFAVSDGVLFVKFTIANGTFEANPSFHVLDWPTTRRLPCQPITVLRPSSNNLFVACVNTSDSAYLNNRFIKLNLNMENLAASTLNPTPIYSGHLTIPISLTTFISDVDTGCPSNDPLNHIVFANRNFINVYSILNSNIFYDFQTSEHCLRADSLEYYGGYTLLVRCPNSIAERVDLCDENTIQLYTESVTGIPYPCGSWDTVAYLRSSGIDIEAHGFQTWQDNLTLAGVRNAECVAVDDKVFVALLIDDRVVVMETGSEPPSSYSPTRAALIHPVALSHTSRRAGSLATRMDPTFC